MSLNTRKQRSYLYGITFMKWSIEERLNEFLKTSIEVTTGIHTFSTKANDETLKKLEEAVADFEVMLETAEETFPNMRGRIDAIKKAKLIHLQKHTKIQDEAEAHERKANFLKDKASNIKTVIKNQENQTIKSKGLKNLLGM